MTLYTRGKKPIDARIPGDTDASYAAFASKLKHIAGDRQDSADVVSKLKGSGFQVVYDINGREVRVFLCFVFVCAWCVCACVCHIPSQHTHTHTHTHTHATTPKNPKNTKAVESQPLLDALQNDGLEQYIYCSSAGVYLKSDQMPHREEDATDLKSRHKVCVVGVCVF